MKIKEIENFFNGKEKTEKDKEKIKLSEQFYTDIYFLALKEISFVYYTKAKKIAKEEDYLEEFLKNYLPENIFKQVIIKVQKALALLNAATYYDSLFSYVEMPRVIKEEILPKEFGKKIIEKQEPEENLLPIIGKELGRKIRFIE